MGLRVVQGGLPPQRHVILVVDDEPIIRFSLALHLQENGFEVLEARDAADAIAALQEPNCQIDLVFTDVRMPGEKDGLDLARWVFKNRPNVPVIIASGDLGKTTALNDLCGAEAISKPFGYDTAVQKIRNAIKSKILPS